MIGKISEVSESNESIKVFKFLKFYSFGKLLNCKELDQTFKIENNRGGTNLCDL